MAISYCQPKSFFQIFLADCGRFFWRSCAVWHAIQLNDGPSAEIDFAQRVKDRWQVNLTSAQFDPTIGLCLTRGGCCWLHILYMQKEQALTVFLDRLGRISPALEVVSNIKRQFGIARIGGVQNLV